MNGHQILWWHQTRSDMEVLAILRSQGANPCHQLHYLQMASEKLGKAHFCGPGSPPPRSHAAFGRFLRALGSLPQARRGPVGQRLGFRSYVGLQSWINSALPLAYGLERLAPALAQDGPNPEYPWPQDDPTECPADYQFPIWGQLTTMQGRQFVKMLRALVDHFPGYV